MADIVGNILTIFLDESLFKAIYFILLFKLCIICSGSVVLDGVYNVCTSV